MKFSKTIKKFCLSLLIIIPILLSGCELNINLASNKDKNVSSIESSAIDSSIVKENNNKYCFWEVTSKDLKGKLYLFGSIHAADDTAYPLNEAVLNAYINSDSLAVECDIVAFEKNIAAQVETSKQLIYTDGTTITDHIDKETYEGLKKLLTDNNLYISTYDKCKPSMWESLADSLVVKKSGLDDKKGLDRFFLTQAKKDGKEILEVESVKFQMDMLAGFSDELMNLMLKSYLTDFDKQVKSLNELYTVWKAGDTDKLYNLGSEEEDKLTEKDKALADDYNKQMLTDRNKGMVDKAEKYMADGKNVFYVVGAMHMVGDDGIVKLLEAKGYTVKRL